jgi:hypothetical protein
MKKILMLCVIWYLLLGCSPILPKPYSIRHSSIILPKYVPYTGVTKPVIKINNYILVSEGRYSFTSGTGFVMERNNRKFLVTAHHVLDGVYVSEFFTYDHKPLELELGKVYIVPHLDGVVIELVSCSASLTPLKMGTYKQDGRTKVMGFAQGESLRESYGFNYSSPIESTAEVDFGMSGGPVLDENGGVIGIISKKDLCPGPIKSHFSRLEDIFYRIDHK